MALEYVRCSGATQTAIVDFRGMPFVRNIGLILTPIPRNKIKFPIVVEITYGQAIPESPESIKAKVARMLAENSMLIDKDSDRPPFRSSEEIGPAIPVHIGENG